MKSRYALLLFAVFALCGASSPSSPPRAPLTAAQLASIDSFVADEMSRTHTPGVQVGIYSHGEILLAKGYGLANVELGAPVKPQTKFQSGSVGKQFTSAAIMMLVEQGRVSLDDSITKYFPTAPASWKRIRIQNLLSHTSGLAEYESADRTGPKGPFYLRLDFTEKELLSKIEALPIENAPGAKWNYRNTNYVLLGMLIHRVTGLFYADYLSQRIFKPLGMSSTRLISEHDVVPNRAAGYQWENETLKNQDWVSPTFNSTADGTLYFNVLDLAKWDTALYGTSLLKQSSLDKTWTIYKLANGKPNPANYGFGWEINRQNGHLAIEHSGAWQGFTCNISRYPNDALAVAVLTNFDSARPVYMTHVIAGLADASLLPQKLKPITDNQPLIAASFVKLLNTINAGASIRKLASPEFASVIVPSDSAWMKGQIARVWPGSSVTLVQRKSPGPSVIASQFRLAKGRYSMLVTYVLNKYGKIEGLSFEPDREYQSRD